MNATAEELQAFYQNTLIAQYATKPKAVATIGALIAGANGDMGLIANALPNQVRDGFDITTAVGKQLDLLGKLRGVARYTTAVSLSKTFLPLPRYDAAGVGTLPGIATYEDAVQPPSTYIMTYSGFVQNTIQDGDFRRVIKFQAAVQSCDYAYGTLDAICYTFFAGNVNLIVTGAMQIEYEHLTSDTDNLFAIINQMGLLPAPAGVNVTTTEVGSF